MAFLFAIAAASMQLAASAQVGIDRSAATMTNGDPATFDLAGFKLGMSEADVEQIIKTRRLKVVRASRFTSFDEQVRSLLRVRGERALIKGGSVLGEAEFDDGQGGRVLIKMLTWPTRLASPASPSCRRGARMGSDGNPC